MCVSMCVLFVFVKQKTAYEMRISDWSSDVCSSDLRALGVCRIQILNKEVASHEPAIIRAHRFAVNLGNQCCLVRIDPVLDSTNAAKPPALIDRKSVV